MNAANVSPPNDSNQPGPPTRKHAYVRWTVRLALLIASVAAIFGGSRLSVWVPAASALTAMAALAATWTLPAPLWVGVAIGLVAVVRRRWFCRWVCPTGTCADSVSRLGLVAGRQCPRLPPVGQWIALVTIGGGVLGYPALLWLDPLALLGNSVSLAWDPALEAAWWGALGLGLVLLLSLVWPGVWCMRLCPLGGLQEILAAMGRAPRKAVLPSTGQVGPKSGLRMSRRVILGVLAGLGFSAATHKGRASARRPLRPPGAVDEARFVGLCLRCGNCVRECPSRIIRPATGTHGVAALLSPVLDFTADYCREDCTGCTEVCPSGALAKVTAEEKPAVRIGLPKVDMGVCLLGDDRDCAVCRTWCPYEAIKYVFCEDPDVYTLVPQVDPARCNGCGACQAKCPTEPVAAIVVRPV